LKSLLTNLSHRGPLKTTSGAAGWAALIYVDFESGSTDL